MDLRLRAKSANLADAALNARLDELEKTVAADIVDANKKLLARDAEKSMRYQVWALNQIKQVRTYSAIKEFEIKKIASAVDRNNPMSAAITQAKKTAGETLRKEMIERLAPIDQRVLDEAVSQWFRKVYQQRFADLDETEQLAVVTGFATTVKKLPD
jgi:NurA-like 5'-3' nuclease